jgi:RNA polymerase sigma factor (TIGR02999 family)
MARSPSGTILEGDMHGPPLRGADVTSLLHRWQGGDAQALDELTPLVYRELHRIAGRHVAGEYPSHTLQATALVHEAFLKLVDQRRVEWQNRAHFFNLAATLMRRILVDHARSTHRLKRGAAVPNLSLDELTTAGEASTLDLADILTLDRALEELHSLDPRQCQIVELRFFGGLTVEEVADAMTLSTGTIKREWAIARAWLYQRLAAKP